MLMQTVTVFGNRAVSLVIRLVIEVFEAALGEPGDTLAMLPYPAAARAASEIVSQAVIKPVKFSALIIKRNSNGTIKANSTRD